MSHHLEIDFGMMSGTASALLLLIALILWRHDRKGARP